MREGGRILAKILKAISQNIAPGISTKKLEYIADEMFKKYKVIPSFKGYHGFPSSICVSVNDEVVHGIPKENKILKSGDIVKIDIGVVYKGFHTDAGATFPCGKITSKAKKLLQITKESLMQAIKKAKDGNKVNDIGYTIEKYVKKFGFSPVRVLTGHGIGRKLHEFPEVPNFFSKYHNFVLHEGMTIAIEPMINEGKSEVYTDEIDGWTVITQDYKLSAYFEHTIVITKKGGKILTQI